MERRPQGQTPPLILVTGAAGGIGRACTALAAADGRWRVAAWDLDPGATGLDCEPVDCTDAAQVDRALDELERRDGPVSALVHTAGTLRVSDPLHPDPADWDALWRVNTLGTAVTCSAVARRMVERHAGSIVAVTSNAAATPRIRMDAYAASKAAALSYVRSLALRVARSGVRCNSVSPGSTETAMLTGGAERPLTDAARAELLAGLPEDFRLGIPLGRVADPEDVARTCLWLASDESRHVTAHDLRVDGGATLDSR